MRLIYLLLFAFVFTAVPDLLLAQNRPLPRSDDRPLRNPGATPGKTPGAQNGGTSRRGSRVIDDTTKQVYGPKTSSYFYESDVFYNRKVLHPIDTFIRNFHWHNNWIHRNRNFYQDLGTIGTAANRIFYQAPYEIGVKSGFDVYNIYWESERIRYFDTKSPYTNMNVDLGGKGRSITKATYSRNINPHWNIGFDYRGIFIDKQVPVRIGKGDRAARGHYYDFFTAYHTKDSTYRAFANFQRMFHQVSEPGGVNLSEGQSYFDDDVNVRLSAAESNDLRINVHLHQQFQVGKALQVYHTLDRYRQKVKFLDMATTDGAFFTNIEEGYLVNDSIRDPAKFKVVRNEFGLKGNLSKLFYNGYYGIRHYNMTYYHDSLQNWFDNERTRAQGQEHFVGGRMELNLDSIGIVNGRVEFNEEGNYAIEGNIVSKWFRASLSQKLYKPTFAQQAYVGIDDSWHNAFENVESSQLKGNLQYRSSVLTLSPGVAISRLKNFIYFEQQSDSIISQLHDTSTFVRPVQARSEIYFVMPEINWSLTFFRHIRLTNQVIMSNMINNPGDAIRLPRLFTNTQLSYDNIFFNGNLDMHAGVDVHWKSDYYAQAYDPVIRQFYNQDVEVLKAYPVIDVFFNAKVKRGRIFIKYNNVVHFIRKLKYETSADVATRDNIGYFATPEYPGQRSILDFGFDWSFYD